MNLTPKELQALKGIARSEFMDGQPEANKWVWTWSGNPFPNKRTYSGAVASLVKKGLVKTTDMGEDACVALTEAGLLALKLKQPSA